MDEIKGYPPFNKQEKKDIKAIINFCKKYDGNIYTCDNTECHLTASCWILNPDRTKVLMTYHNILKNYALFSGHTDGNKDLKQVAEKELKKETGIKNPKLLSHNIFSIEILPIDETIINAKIVKPHLHLNFTYIFEVDESETLKIKENENIRWIETDKLFDYIKDNEITTQIYTKFMQKISYFKDVNYYDFIKEFL
ncbi:MAG: NUDIX hydrolase [Alphaproteobacteria bacterium]